MTQETPKYLMTPNKLRVKHFAQLPCEPFIVDVDNEAEAYKICNVLADQHLFLEKEGIIPDYSNIILVEMYDTEDNDWVDYYNEAEQMDWEEFSETYLSNTQN